MSKKDDDDDCSRLSTTTTKALPCKPYGEEVHRTLADNGFAPALHDVRSETGLAMVVMELIEGAEPFDGANEKHAKALREVGMVLQENNFVHGDLRVPNILVREDSLYVVDFDWAGKEGEARYPDVPNPEETWPDGAEVGAPITKKHDAFMINRLCNSR